MVARFFSAPPEPGTGVGLTRKLIEVTIVPPWRYCESYSCMTLVLEQVLGSSSALILGSSPCYSYSIRTYFCDEGGFTAGALPDAVFLPKQFLIAELEVSAP